MDRESVRSFEDGECIFREGEESRQMYVVQEGMVVVSKRGPGGRIVLAELERGEFLGEMSLLESLPRHADAHAKGSTRLLAIQPGGFLLKIRRDPTFAFELMQSLSRRIRQTNDKLLGKLQEGSLEESELRKILEESGP